MYRVRGMAEVPFHPTAIHRIVALGLATLLLGIAGSCSSGSATEDAKREITSCMQGNGGVVVKKMETRIDDGVLHVDSISYNGRGSDSFDAVFLQCFRSAAEKLGLEVGSTIKPLRP